MDIRHSRRAIGHFCVLRCRGALLEYLLRKLSEAIALNRFLLPVNVIRV